jgi:hypothetical protein
MKRVTASLINWHLALIWVKNMAYSYCPQLCWALVWFKSNTLMVFNHVQAFG